jgi:hypothetical protein
MGQAEALLELGDLAGQRGEVTGVALRHLHGDRDAVAGAKDPCRRSAVGRAPRRGAWPISPSGQVRALERGAGDVQGTSMPLRRWRGA